MCVLCTTKRVNTYGDIFTKLLVVQSRLKDRDGEREVREEEKMEKERCDDSEESGCGIDGEGELRWK